MFGTYSRPLADHSVVSGRERVVATMLRWLQWAWSGSPDLPAHLRMEQRFIAIRYLGLLFVTPALPLLGLAQERLTAAYIVLLFDAIYNIAVQILLHRRSSMLNHGYFTTIGDGVLALAILMIGGGFDSPFYPVLILITVAASMRYGYGPALLMVGLYVLLDLCLTTFARATGGAGSWLFRSSFLVITVVLAGYLQEQARAAEMALARQLQRARALNESTRALSASLDLDTVMHTVAVESRALGAGK